MKLIDKLSFSEKRLLKYGSILVVVVLVWVLIYKPITGKIIHNQQKVQKLQAQYKQMKDSTKMLKKQFNKVNNFSRNPNKPFISWIDAQLAKNNLSQYVTRAEPKDNNTLIISFENIVFDELVAWLETLEKNYSISINEADISGIDRDNGLCNARLTLEENI